MLRKSALRTSSWDLRPQLPKGDRRKNLPLSGNDFPDALLSSAQNNIAASPERLHWRLGR